MKVQLLELDSGASLTAYILDQSTEMAFGKARPAMLILPGGGYHRVSDREGEPIAMAFAALGYQTFVLKYSVGKHLALAQPLADAECAMQLIIDHATEWCIDVRNICAIGFSAGGHLAATLGTCGRIRPSAMVLGYPSTLDTTNHILAFPVNNVVPDQATPPTFIFHTADDTVVPAQHSLAFATALDALKISYELHIFDSGLHGMSLGTEVTDSSGRNNPHVAKWFGLATAWLARQRRE